MPLHYKLIREYTVAPFLSVYCVLCRIIPIESLFWILGVEHDRYIHTPVVQPAYTFHLPASTQILLEPAVHSLKSNNYVLTSYISVSNIR